MSTGVGGVPTRCQACRKGPVRNVTFRVFVGRIVFYREEEYWGTFCNRCGLALFWKTMGRHLLHTWWSPKAAVFGFIAIFLNLYQALKFVLLDDPREIPYEGVSDVSAEGT